MYVTVADLSLALCRLCLAAGQSLLILLFW
jgi:hypothetical protein